MVTVEVGEVEGEAEVVGVPGLLGVPEPAPPLAEVPLEVWDKLPVRVPLAVRVGERAGVGEGVEEPVEQGVEVPMAETVEVEEVVWEVVLEGVEEL